MNWLLLIVTCIVLVEVVVRLPLMDPVRRLNSTARKSVATMRAAGVSDHWKEKAMLAYSGRTMSATLKIAAMLAVVVAVAAGLIAVLDMVNAGFNDFALGWRGILGGTVAACVYGFVRLRVLRG